MMFGQSVWIALVSDHQQKVLRELCTYNEVIEA